MMGARADALEWALALSKAPAERVALRQRALPVGMEGLLQVAAGVSADALSEAASRTGEEPDVVVDAARFYAREILFHQGADAYRVLGLNRDAGAEQVKSHHRLLQQWLHPDRQTSDWDAIFAARVNAAWSHLRSEDRRAEYDQANPPRTLEAASTALPSAHWLHQGEGTAHPDPVAKWRRRVPVLALFAVCGVLGLAALRDMQAPVDDSPELAQAIAPDQAIAALSLPDASAKPDKSASVEKRRKQQAKPANAVSRAASPAGSKNDSAPGATMTARVAQLPVSASSAPANRKAAVPTAPRVATAAAAATQKAAPDRLQRTDAAGQAKPRAVSGSASTTTAAPPRVARAASVPSSVPASTTSIPPKPAAADQVADATSPALTVNDARVAVPAPEVPIQRVQQAQQVGDRLMAYMATTAASTPPIWGSLTAQRGAAQLRTNLHSSEGVRIASPRWRVGSGVAAMQSNLKYPDGSAGRLSADLVWREQRWLVTGLSLERDL